MMNKQLAFVKSGLGLALCFLMVGAGVTPPIHASNANVSISQQAKKVTGTVTDAKGVNPAKRNVMVVKNEMRLLKQKRNVLQI
ncbi:hypothetical protein ABHC64_07465 [Parabacteroides distasonis]|uniref:hypothetical protein n=1 Tax=Parabacteroides distasonis TaxID=823 RepID=UPI00233023AF|nr:hypothetical protein [Parabacteroides distasonis]MDB9062384.1 hypothetical protein [Parabacteroides distasonis]